jgi:TolB protein
MGSQREQQSSTDCVPLKSRVQAIRRAGGMGYYVHPALTRDPLGSITAPHAVPVELLPGAILGDVDGLEIVCIWSDELGTSAIWYHLLNLGRAIVPTAGTDSFPNYFRGMSVGTARSYANVGSNGNSYSDFLKALQQGRSLVTNGPIPLLSVEAVEPGGAISTAKNPVDWHLKILTPVPVRQLSRLTAFAERRMDCSPSIRRPRIVAGDGQLPVRAYGANLGRGNRQCGP